MHACAYVVGAESGPGTALLDLARRLGFQIVLPYSGVAQAEQQAASTPICFFLFAEVLDVRSMGSVAQAIRFSSGRRIRFSPMIYFSNNPSMEAIKACINMGFDDIITRPFTKTRVGIRLQRQLNPDMVMSFYFMEDPVVGGYTPEKVALRKLRPPSSSARFCRKAARQKSRRSAASSSPAASRR